MVMTVTNKDEQDCRIFLWKHLGEVINSFKVNLWSSRFDDRQRRMELWLFCLLLWCMKNCLGTFYIYLNIREARKGMGMM